MEPEPIVAARFTTYGEPVEITNGGYVMVKVRYREDAMRLIETLAKAASQLPARYSTSRN